MQLFHFLIYAKNKSAKFISQAGTPFPYSVVIPAYILVIADFLFHDDSRLELDDQLIGRDYFDACYQPSDKVIIRFRYLAGLALQKTV